MEGKRIKVVVCGINGKMGTLIKVSVLSDERFELYGGVEKKSGGEIDFRKDGTTVAPIVSEWTDEFQNADVIIDFSSPQGTRWAVEFASQYNIPIVIGTTALPENVLSAIEKSAEHVPVVQSPNMSVGVNLLFAVLPQIAQVLGKDYDIEIIEAHHRMKKDAPSGTAMKMVAELANARNLDPDKIIIGRKGERSCGEIGIHAVRGGDIVGEHTVMFLGDGERIEISHRVSNRETFAKGALRAAEWVVNQPAGLYSMMDVLGLRKF